MRGLAGSLSNVADGQMITHKREEALANYNRALAISEKLVSVIEAEDVTSCGKAGRATASELEIAALVAADRALSIMLNELWIETNRARAHVPRPHRFDRNKHRVALALVGVLVVVNVCGELVLR
jgi:hypothetical protein